MQKVPFQEYTRVINDTYDSFKKVQKVKFLHVPISESPSILEGDHNFLIKHVFGTETFSYFHVNYIDTFLYSDFYLGKQKHVNTLATAYAQSYYPKYNVSRNPFFGPILLVTNLYDDKIFGSTTMEAIESFIRLYYRNKSD